MRTRSSAAVPDFGGEIAADSKGKGDGGRQASGVRKSHPQVLHCKGGPVQQRGSSVKPAEVEKLPSGRGASTQFGRDFQLIQDACESRVTDEEKSLAASLKNTKSQLFQPTRQQTRHTISSFSAPVPDRISNAKPTKRVRFAQEEGNRRSGSNNVRGPVLEAVRNPKTKEPLPACSAPAVLPSESEAPNDERLPPRTTVHVKRRGIPTIVHGVVAQACGEVQFCGVCKLPKRNAPQRRRPTMVASLPDEDRPQPWLKKRKTVPATTRETRKTSKAVLPVEITKEAAPSNQPGGIVKGRKKSQSKVQDTTKGQKKAQPIGSASVAVVLGMAHNAVPDVQELRRKTEEDALACGRVPRSVSNPGKVTECPTITSPVQSGEEEFEPTPVMPSSVGGRSETTPPVPESECPINVGEDGVNDAEKETFDGHEKSVGDIPGIRQSDVDVQETRNTTYRKVTTTFREKVHPGARTEREYETSSEEQRDHGRRRYRRSASPTNYYSNTNSGRRRRQYDDSPRSDRRESHRHSDYSSSKSPPHHRYGSSREYGRRRSRHSRSRTPSFHDDRHLQPESSKYRDYLPRSGRGLERYGRSPNRSPVRSRRQPSADGGRSHRRSVSPIRQRTRQRSPVLSPPHDSFRRNSDADPTTERRSSSVVNVDSLQYPSPALDRRTRRHKQAVREEEMARRQRNGEKPFYLTLDADGKPYGPGRPAWVAEIFKLATGLDPSCTHIARQTYEAVTTFRERLDERFEYSGALNADYLRAMMGKAVTRRRGELIAAIDREEAQPLHIDHEVWQRLVKLAGSTQRHEKSEQGKRANASRKTLGRTGRCGVNGVRERLRELLKRSPDPEEIELEMNRDKGFNGPKKRYREDSGEFEERRGNSDMHSLRSGGQSHLSGQSETEDDDRDPFHEEELLTRKEVEKQSGTGGSGSSMRNSRNIEALDTSNAEYIKELQAEIDRLRAGTGMRSKYNTNGRRRSEG